MEFGGHYTWDQKASDHSAVFARWRQQREDGVNNNFETTDQKFGVDIIFRTRSCLTIQSYLPDG